MTEIFEYDYNSKNSKIREFIRLNFPTSLRFYDNLEIADKRKYFVHIKRKNNPLSPEKWYAQQEYKKYEYSFAEIATILQITKEEATSAYLSALRKLKIILC